MTAPETKEIGTWKRSRETASPPSWPLRPPWWHASAAPTGCPSRLPDPSLSAPEVDTVELETLVQSWPAVVDYVRQGNAMLAATLEAASPAAL